MAVFSRIVMASGGVLLIAGIVQQQLQDRSANVPPVPFDDDAGEAIARAGEASAYRGSLKTTVDDVLLAILEDRSSPAALLLTQSGVDVDAFYDRVKRSLPSKSILTEPQPLVLEHSVKRVIEIATKEAFDAHHASVDPGHLLMGVLQIRRSNASRMLRNGGVTIEQLREASRRLKPPA